MNPSGMNPLDVKVIVKPAPVEEKSAGGIIFADTTKDKEKYASTRGELIAKGPNAFMEWGKGNAPAEGASILYAQYAGSRFRGPDGVDYWIMNDEDVIGVAA